MASATTGKARRLVLKPRAFQVYKDGTRFRVLASGRRFGKTFLAADELIKFATRKNGAVCWYVAPTFKMAERIMWVILKNSIPDAWIAKKNETKLMITLINGSTISLCGAENYDALRGSGIDFVVLDEFAFMAVAAWNEVIRPGLSDKEGHALFISSPDGLNHFYDFFKRGVVPSKEWKSWRFSTIEGGWVSAKEIMAAKAELDERTFAQEYLGEFINFAGRVAYNFSESNYDKELFYNPNKPLLIGFDFNNAPGVAAVAQEQNMPGQFEKSMVQGQEISAPITGLGFIGEVWIPKHSNTILVCKKLYEDWQGHAGEVIVYGDASGGNKTAQGVGGSDWDLIKNFFKQTKWADRIKYEVPRANPRIRARINATTSMIRSVDGKIRLMMDAEQCPHIIEDFERLTVIEGTTG
ncbi:MAG: hypothetical protein EOM80_19140, partial [Erysipelotrichia bacterium]|nr:hypothetical protein [Erysipelotrichia bacterium]